MILYTQEVDYSGLFVIKKEQMIKYWPKGGYYCKTPISEGIKSLNDILKSYLGGDYDYNVSYTFHNKQIILKVTITEINKEIKMYGMLMDCSFPYLFTNRVEVY
jgi:hypothetical protein